MKVKRLKTFDLITKKTKKNSERFRTYYYRHKLKNTEWNKIYLNQLHFAVSDKIKKIKILEQILGRENFFASERIQIKGP